MKKITRGFTLGDRYRYDFGPCTAKNGWAQIDTDQDAPYFGQWANPFKLEVFSYVEGDTTLVQCETAEEFAAELREIDKFNVEIGYRNVKIDGMCHTPLIDRFKKIGLGDMLH